MWQIKNAKRIDHNIVAINVYGNTSYRNASSIKFGSYDEKAIDPGYNKGRPTMFQTITNTAWSIRSDFLSFGGNQITGSYSVNLNPGLPFIYVPKEIFADISSSLPTVIKELKCSDQLNICKASQSCDSIDKSFINNRTTSIHLTSSLLEEMNYTVPISDLLIDANSIGLSPTKDVECVLGIFKQSKATNSIYIGAVGMLNYYIIYDMSPLDEGNLSTIRMGIGKKNPNYDVLQSQYNSTCPYYDHQPGDQSYWVDLSSHFQFQLW